MRLDLKAPRSWNELSQQQLRDTLEAIVAAQQKMERRKFRDAEDYSTQTAAYAALLLLMKWNGLKLICPYGSGYLIRCGKSEVELSAELLAAASESLMWVKSLPAEPVRLDTVDGACAIAADISADLSFDEWLACETDWQTYQLTRDEEWLLRMAEILYKKDNIRPDHAELIGVFYWWAGVKTMVSNMFPSFFKPAASTAENDASPDDMRRNIDAQIRALTKGDITKEKEVLAMEAVRALTELDAQAREYEELNKKYPKK